MLDELLDVLDDVLELELELELDMLNELLTELDELLDPAVYTDGPKCNALQAKRAGLSDELAPLEAEWARRAEEA